jgi:signal transduction histidine kinase/ligand-binding sensor domain-containing protein
MRWRILIILLWLSPLLARPVSASGPDPGRPIKQMRHALWNEASGLSGSVYALAQTVDGFLWVGTSTGLYRFDGLKFERFLELADDRPVLEVRALLATSDGGLWIGYRNGVAFLKQGKASFYTEQQGLPYGRVRSLAQTQDGAVWATFTSAGGEKWHGGPNSLAGLARLSGGRWEEIRSNWNYPAYSAEKVLVDAAGTLWVTGGGSIYFLPLGSRSFQQTAVKVSSWTELSAGPDGSVWIADAVAHTLFNFRKSPQHGYVLVSGDPLQGIYGMFFDNYQSLWIATDRGVFRVLPGLIADVLNVTTDEIEKDQFRGADGLSSEETNVVFEDREGNIWVGTMNGLDRFSDGSVTQINMGHTPFDLIVGPHSEVWASKYLSPFMIPLHDSKPYPLRDWFTRSYYMDRTGTLWAAMQSDSTWESRALWKDQHGRFSRVPSPPGIKGPSIEGIVGDATGRLWMTITGYGEFTLKDGKWEMIPIFTGKDHDISPDAQFVDTLGRAWLVYYARDTVVMIDGAKRTFFTPGHGLDLGNPIIGSASGTQVWVSGTGGLGFFDGERFRNIRASDGSLFGYVSAVIPTEHDGLWLKVPDGVLQIPQDEITAFLSDHSHAVRYRSFDGATDFVSPLARRMPSPSGSDAVRSGDGKLWFTVFNGVAMIDPAHLAKNDVPPPVFIRNLTANGRAYSTSRDLTLPKHTRGVSLDYTALSLTLAERNRFRYQLVGLDKDWQDAGTRRQAFYTNLAPGTYTFKVIAANNDGVWNETGASITFTIPPTFFQTIWFDLLMIAVAGCAIWVLYALRLKQATAAVSARLGERLRERERIARELHDTLLQSFTAVLLRLQAVSKVLPVQPDEAKRRIEVAIEQADDAITEGRDAVHELRSNGITVDEPSEALANFAKELLSEDPPESVPEIVVQIEGTPRPLNPAVRDEVYRIGGEALRNAIRHSRAKRIEVEMLYHEHYVRMCIRDNGAGIDPAILNREYKDGHWGLRGMKERAKLVGGTLGLWSHVDVGTEVDLHIPAASVYAKSPSPRWSLASRFWNS